MQEVKIILEILENKNTKTNFGCSYSLHMFATDKLRKNEKRLGVREVLMISESFQSFELNQKDLSNLLRKSSNKNLCAVCYRTIKSCDYQRKKNTQKV